MGMELKERKVLSKRTVSKTSPLGECGDGKHLNGKEVEGRGEDWKEKRISIVLWFATSLDHVASPWLWRNKLTLKLNAKKKNK